MNEVPMFQFALREDLKNEGQFLPNRTTPVSTGWDVRCAQKDRAPVIARPGQYVKIPLGFRAIAPAGWWLELRPRSSTFAKKQLHSLYGVIDSDYRNELAFVASYLPDIRALGVDLVLEFGEPIGQLVPVRLQDMAIEQITNEQFDDIVKNEHNVRDQRGFGATRGLK